MSGREMTSWLLKLALAICVAACSNGAKKGAGNGTKTVVDANTKVSAKCTKLRDHVAGLYNKAEPPDKNPKKQARRDMVMADNVTMVLTDCNKNPKQFAPCIESAATASQLERDCLLKLDDDGEVEGNYFTKKP